MTQGPSSTPVRVLVVDDHADVRFLVRTILRDAGPPLEVAGEASGAEEAVAAVERRRSTSSCSTPGCRWSTASRPRGCCSRAAPGLPILLCSAIVDDEVRERAEAAGIAACLSKDHFEAIPRVALELAGRAA